MTDRLRGVRARLLALLALVALAAAMVVAGAGPASAHATLLESDPVQGAVLPEAPERIRFTYTEAVAAVPDGVQVFDAEGGSVRSTAQVAGDTLDVVLTDEVGSGTLIVVWRVISEDGHPVSGSLSFSIGAASAEVTQPPAGATGSTDAPLALELLRWLSYLGLFTAVGLVAFALLILPRDGVAEDARRSVVRLARYGGGLTALAWLTALPVAALYQVGGDAGALVERSTWSTVTPTEYGVAAAVVIGANLAVVLIGDGLPSEWRRVAALVAGAIAVCAPALTGHTRAAVPELLVVGADMLHLVAGSIWFGGLLGLAVVLPGLLARGVVAAEVLARFSGIAAGVLTALVVTGSVLAWRIVGSWSALVETTYGQLLLLKSRSRRSPSSSRRGTGTGCCPASRTRHDATSPRWSPAW